MLLPRLSCSGLASSDSSSSGSPCTRGESERGRETGKALLGLRPREREEPAAPSLAPRARALRGRANADRRAPSLLSVCWSGASKGQSDGRGRSIGLAEMRVSLAKAEGGNSKLVRMRDSDSARLVCSSVIE